MASTFFGLETAKRGMNTQQSALYVTGHNISNANTPGYSRQRVNFSTTTPYAAPGLNRPGGPGQFGTGVEAGSIQRIRDRFADDQFRIQNNSVGYYGSQYEALTKMEEIMNEPSNSGLHSTMEKFWNSLQTLATHPENSGARDVVAATGQMVADTFNYYHNSLTRVQNDLGNQINVKVKDINDTLESIKKLNQQISEVEPHGLIPNDLYDARDALVDKLSGLVNIKVTPVKPTAYGNASPIAEGLYNIEILKADGTSYATKLNLVEVDQAGISHVNQIGIKPDLTNNAGSPVTEITVGTTALKGKDMNVGGELAGLVQSYGYDDGTGTVKGTYPEMLKQINNMAKAFADEFNRIHRNGKSLDGNGGLDFFIIAPSDPAKSIKVNEAISKDSTLLAAGLATVVGESGSESGNNKNAQLLADLKTKAFTNYGKDLDKNGTWKEDLNLPNLPKLPDGLTGNLDTFYSGVIGALGVTSQSAEQNLKNAGAIAVSVEQRRQSVSAVSFDEEMVNMIKFQHAYNASARNITVVDEMLDKIINGMGVVGR